LSHFQRYLIAGVLTLGPLWVTWIALRFLFNLFGGIGRPWVRGMARALSTSAPGVADVLMQPWFTSTLALVIVLIGLYALGWASTNVFGRRVLSYLEGLLQQIPLVRAIYMPAKEFVSALESRPGGEPRRVVLIDFPSREMKAVGFVTRTMVDRVTGKEVAFVYVPTSPNPTSGYMEIVPVERLTTTDWTVEEATRFVVTGGTSGPARIVFGADGSERPEQST